MRDCFIHEHRHQCRLVRLGAALNVSRSGYYPWLTRPPSRRAQTDCQLLRRSKRGHAWTRGRYGAIKTWHALTAAGGACGRERVVRLRRQAGIVAQRLRRFRVLTEHHHWVPPAPSHLTAGVNSTRLNHIWAGDPTAIPTRAG